MTDIWDTWEETDIHVYLQQTLLQDMWSKSKNTTNKNNLEIKTVMVMIWMITWTKTQQKSNKL